MNRSAQEILEDARQLPPSEVNWLIENLLQEGNGGTDAEIEAAWDSEIKRRLDEIDSGAVKMIPLDDVIARMDAKLRRIKRLNGTGRAATLPLWASTRRSALLSTLCANRLGQVPPICMARAA
jgi:putative addiction module component (TIGR02574 family)